MAGGQDSEQTDLDPDSNGGDKANSASSDASQSREVVEPWIWALAALLLAVPAAIPLVVLIDPSAVPFVAVTKAPDGGTYWFLVGLSAVILTVNWGFLYVIRRWLNRYGHDDSPG